TCASEGTGVACLPDLKALSPDWPGRERGYQPQTKKPQRRARRLFGPIMTSRANRGCRRYIRGRQQLDGATPYRSAHQGAGAPFSLCRRYIRGRQGREALGPGCAWGQAALRLPALDLPVRLSATSSKLTFWPSLRLFIPARSTALMWTNTSDPPLSGWMKPNPFWALNHFTVPTGMVFPFARAVVRRHEASVGQLISTSREGRGPAVMVSRRRGPS